MTFKNNTYRAKVVRVVDGDTVDLDVDLGFYMTTRIRARLLGVDTPERGQTDYAKATTFLATLLDQVTDQDGYIELQTEKTGKYGRWLVYIKGVNDQLEAIWPYDR